jgi:hypothetical protein
LQCQSSQLRLHKKEGDVDSEKIEPKLRRTNFLTRSRCTICGGHIEKEAFLIEAESGHGTIRACWLCLLPILPSSAMALLGIEPLHDTLHELRMP